MIFLYFVFSCIKPKKRFYIIIISGFKFFPLAFYKILILLLTFKSFIKDFQVLLNSFINFSMFLYKRGIFYIIIEELLFEVRLYLIICLISYNLQLVVKLYNKKIQSI